MSRGRTDFSRAWANAFWNRTRVAGADECWPWVGTINSQGRATFSVGSRSVQRRVNASRYSYWLHKGQIEPGQVICHQCDSPSCVNPAHLFAGSQADNLADMTAKGRRSRFALRGEAAPGCKVTDAQAHEALARIEAGETGRKVAAELGVHPGTIAKLRRRLAR